MNRTRGRVDPYLKFLSERAQNEARSALRYTGKADAFRGAVQLSQSWQSP
jgi:hypothetical protein